MATDALRASALAAVLSGAPSTIAAISTGTDPLQASLAAGSLMLPHETRPSRLLPAAVAVHGSLSLAWSLVLSALLPRRSTLRWAGLAGVGIAVLDLGVVGRRLPRIRALPLLPQVADHLAFAITAGVVLRRCRSSRDAVSGRALGRR